LRPHLPAFFVVQQVVIALQLGHDGRPAALPQEQRYAGFYYPRQAVVPDWQGGRFYGRRLLGRGELKPPVH